MDPKVADDLERLYAAWAEAERRDRPRWPADLRCPAGCSICCERSPDVPVTPAEAAHVAEAVERLPAARRSVIRRRISETARWITDAGRADRSRAPGPCPLLEEPGVAAPASHGRLCAVYADRPLVCRAYGFAADGAGTLLGCEILEPVVRAGGPIPFPDHAAARAALPDATVLDREGRALPPSSPLPEALDRLLPR